MKKVIATALLFAATASPAFSNASTNFEAPKRQTTTATFDFVGVETFDSAPLGTNQTYVTTFGTAGASTVITGTYTGLDVLAASPYGGAGGTGRFADATTGGSYRLDLSTSDGSELNYFGFWLSALDGGNTLTFYKGGETVYTISPGDVVLNTGSCSGGSPYCGNPNTGEVPSEQFAFINVHFDAGQSYDSIVFSQWNQGNGHYESDNHTIGYFRTPGGVPEAATWAMMIMGFGMVGAAARRRNKSAVAA